eukprot:CAMPEP_0172928668 /NCGR_PEP_ID=MMETSP1075-20121228/218094_1 /TAXON_ID=2916 /ORGANISM="Ceratium fusus, Strain PA161109" /LENGTH=195 /DNA_ID=CAMNT_0013789955 /DNA_START=339 /DNA_END=926 /DNA_ORIENTATION=-
MDPSALVRRPAYIELKTGLRTALRADAGGCDSRTRDHALPLAFCGTYHCMRIAHCTIQPAFIALSRRRLLTCPQCSSQYLAEWKVMDVEFITELPRHDTFSAACNVAELAKDDFNPLEGGPNHIVEERIMHEWFRAEFFVTFQFQHVSVMHLVQNWPKTTSTPRKEAPITLLKKEACMSGSGLNFLSHFSFNMLA